jgi:hypothetical protein
MAARYKVNDDEERFLAAPDGASLLFAGSSGTESWIERAEDTVVRLGMQAVAVTTTEGGVLELAIEVGDAAAKGHDGPAPIETRLSACQSLQVLVKAGERVTFKATPSGDGVQVLRTVVWSSDMKPVATGESARRNGEAHRDHAARSMPG